jgi:hypothetical protein
MTHEVWRSRVGEGVKPVGRADPERALEDLSGRGPWFLFRHQAEFSAGVMAFFDGPRW